MIGGELLSEVTHETYTADSSVKGFPGWPQETQEIPGWGISPGGRN